MSSATTTTGTSPSLTQIFPTATSSSPSNNNNNNISSQNPTTYYFVFLGVLVVLLTIAATLSLRAFRIRRRYRTATQLAIMRGEPLPAMEGNEYGWGFGPMVWRGDDGNPGTPAAGGTHGTNRGKGVWEKIPVLIEREVEDDTNEKEWSMEECQPVTLHSLLPRSKPSLPTDQPPSSDRDRLSRPSPTSTSRLDFREMRRQRQRDRNTAHLPITPSTEVTSEINRGVEVGEDVRIAIVIKMPRDPAEIEAEGDMDLEDGEERPGWESGMELGVWEGRVGGKQARW